MSVSSTETNSTTALITTDRNIYFPLPLMLQNLDNVQCILAVHMFHRIVMPARTTLNISTLWLQFCASQRTGDNVVFARFV